MPGASGRSIEFDVAEDGLATSLVRETEGGEFEECKVLEERCIRIIRCLEHLDIPGSKDPTT